MRAPIRAPYSIDEYLAAERASPVRHEYIAGAVYAMAGASEQHNLIAGNLFATLHVQLRRRQCTVYPSDLRVLIPQVPRYTYPDVIVVCGRALFEDTQRDTLLNPTIIAEVLSPSTEKHDRGTKFKQYWSLASVQEYLLIDQESYRLERFARHPADPQMVVFEVYTDPAEQVYLAAIDCTVLLADLYEKVVFDVSEENIP
jgi:Uma2 family endonuclease